MTLFSTAPSSSASLFTLCVRLKGTRLVLPYRPDQRYATQLPLYDDPESRFCQFVQGTPQPLLVRELELIRQHLTVIRHDPLEADDLVFWEQLEEIQRKEVAGAVDWSALGLVPPVRTYIPQSELSFFYQHESGRWEFLHHFNMKCLLYQHQGDHTGSLVLSTSFFSFLFSYFSCKRSPCRLKG
jgi:hypothetical protein